MNCFQNTFLQTQELNNIAKSNIFMKKKFLGTYPADVNSFEEKAKKRKDVAGYRIQMNNTYQFNIGSPFIKKQNFVFFR